METIPAKKGYHDYVSEIPEGGGRVQRKAHVIHPSPTDEISSGDVTKWLLVLPAESTLGDA